MKLDLTGKTALVTASTAGIGFAIAKGLVECGAATIVNGRTGQRVTAAVEAIKKGQPDAEVSGIAADLASDLGMAMALRQLPHVDILVHNLGIFEPKAFLEIKDEDWNRFFQTNVMTAVRLTRHCLPAMIHSKWGRVIFISSESAIQIPSEMIHYGMTKTAQLAIARGLAESLAGTGVTVNSVLPGPTRSEGVEAFVENLSLRNNTTPAQTERDFFKTMRPSSLLQRFITPEEVANLVVYVASREASASTGAAFRVDGGVVRSII